MTKEELKDVLGKLRMTQITLARLVDVTPRAVNLWMTGTRGVPGPVAAYLRLFNSLPTGMKQAELARVLKEVTAMKDGMYSIEFTGQGGTGYGALVFDGGRIYGADAAGAKYDGHYQFNETTNLVDVEVRVEMPAGIQSVIGMVQPFNWLLEVSTVIDPTKESGPINVSTNLGRKIMANYRFLRSLPEAA